MSNDYGVWNKLTHKESTMKNIKKILNHIFVDGLSGMALGLFATLIIGTILCQIGSFITGTIGVYIIAIGTIAKALTGAGIGVGVACKFKASSLVSVSAGVCGMVGAWAGKILGTGVVLSFSVDEAGVSTITGLPGEPLGAFVAAFIGIEAGRLIAGKTPLDILLTPLVTILSGSAVGIILGPPISSFMTMLGNLVNMGAESYPFVMGIVVSVLMGMILTLPISSAAIGVSLGLGGIAAGAATIGCSAQMIGFAVASYRENKMGGLLAQGVGTSMLQVPNIVRKPLIWIPPILTSAILGPISTCLLHITNNATGSGMGTSGLVGQIMTYQTMVTEGGSSPAVVITMIIIMHFVAPAILTLGFAELMRYLKLIKNGDMALPKD